MSTSEANRDEWLAERRKGLGGSDSAPATGLSKWKTPLQLFLEKTGQVDDEPENTAMRRGTLLEPAVRQMYADETGRTVVTPTEIIRHPSHDWMLASLDGIASNGSIVVDFKTSRNRAGWGEPGTPEVPVEYLCQVQHYMLVTNIPLAEIAVLFGDFEFAIYPIEADIEFQEMLFEAEADFWRRVQTLDAPEPSNPDDVRRRWPKSFGREVVATPEIVSACERLAAAKAQRDAAEALADTLAAEIQSAMQDGDTLVHGGRTLATWKSAKAPARFDAKRFQKEQAELYESYLTEGKPSRRFLLKK